MDQLLIHSQTRALLEGITQSPPHALLLLGQDGIGKGTLARTLTADILRIPVSKLDEHPNVAIVSTAKDSISIESIRALQQFVRLKTTGKATIRRAIIIEHSGSMTTEAQNAFLKLLEEPPADTVIVMTAGHVHDLLPTIRSRVQHITVNVPAVDDVTAYLKSFPSSNVTQAYFLSGGLPGLMTALLEGDQQHPLFASVAQAKQLLQSTTFDRLLLVESVAKDRNHAKSLCEALARIAQAGIKQSAGKSDDKRLKQWHKILRETHNAQEALSINANTKLVLSNLLLQL